MQTSTIEETAWLDDALARFACSRDPLLRNEIAERAGWIAERSARRFADRGEPFDDLLQVARIGLIKSIERFDPAQGVPFGAFATPTILGELRRHFRDHTWGVHVPRRAKELRPAVNAAREELNGTLGRSPTIAEIAKHLDVPEDAVLESLEANEAYRPHPLEAGTGRHAIDDAPFEQAIDREIVLRLLDGLRPRERTILRLRFYDELSQAQIAERIGTSQVHVGRLIAASLKDLRAQLEDPSEAPS